MNDLVHYRAMESLSRQAGVHHPLVGWGMFAEAERWHHKALEEIASRFAECNTIAPAGPPARTEAVSDSRGGRSQLPAGLPCKGVSRGCSRGRRAGSNDLSRPKPRDRLVVIAVLSQNFLGMFALFRRRMHNPARCPA